MTYKTQAGAIFQLPFRKLHKSTKQMYSALSCGPFCDRAADGEGIGMGRGLGVKQGWVKIRQVYQALYLGMKYNVFIF